MWKDLFNILRKKPQIEHAVRLETPALRESILLFFRVWPLVLLELLSGFVLWTLSVLPWAVAGALVVNSLLRAPINPLSGMPLIQHQLESLFSDPLVPLALAGLWIAALFLGLVVSTFLHAATLLELAHCSHSPAPVSVSFQRAFTRAGEQFPRFLSLTLWFYLCAGLLVGGFLFAHIGELLLLDKTLPTLEPAQRTILMLVQSYSTTLPAMLFLALFYVAYLLCGVVLATEDRTGLSEALALTARHLKENWRPVTRMLLFFFYLYVGLGFLGFLARMGFAHYGQNEALESVVAAAALAWTLAAWVFAEVVWLAGALVQFRLYTNHRHVELTPLPSPDEPPSGPENFAGSRSVTPTDGAPSAQALPFAAPTNSHA